MLYKYNLSSPLFVYWNKNLYVPMGTRTFCKLSTRRYHMVSILLPTIRSIWLPRSLVKIWFCRTAYLTSSRVLLDLSMNFFHPSATLSTALTWTWIVIWKYILTLNLENNKNLKYYRRVLKPVFAVLQRNCYMHTTQSCASLLNKHRKEKTKNLRDMQEGGSASAVTQTLKENSDSLPHKWGKYTSR